MPFEDGDNEWLKIQLCVSQQDPSCCRSLNTLQNPLSPCLHLLCIWIFLSLASRDREDGTAWGPVQPRLRKCGPGSCDTRWFAAELLPDFQAESLPGLVGPSPA